MEKDTKKYRKNPFVKESALEMTEDDSVFFNLVLKPTILSDFAKTIVLRRDIRKILDESMKMKTNPIGSFLSKSLGRFVIPNYNVPLNNQSFEYVLGSLEYLKDNEFFVVEEEIISKIPIIREKTEENKIDYVCVSTANRPEQLRSFLEECKKIQKIDNKLSIIVSDGSLDLDKREGNRKVLEEMKDFFENVYYIDNDNRKGKVKTFSEKTNIDLENISYGLTESEQYYSGGTAKNFMILATAGKNIVMLDDDVVLSDVRVFGDDTDREVSYASAFSMIQNKYKDLESIENHPSNKSILDILQSVVGKNINNVIGSKKVRVGESSDRLLISAKENRGSIKMATLGHFGHSAMWSQDAFLWMQYNRENHISHLSDEEYKKIKQYNFVSNVCNSDLIYDCPSFLSLAFSLDNTSLSPFFEPVGRSEDGIFISFLNTHHSDSYQYFFKEAVHHKRPETWDVLHDIKSRLSLDSIISVLISESFENTKQESYSINARYEKSGNYIKEIAELDFEKFEEEIKSTFDALIDMYYYQIGFGLYLNKEGNSEWRKDMEKDMETLIEMKKGKMDIRYYGQKESMPISEIQKMLHSFGSFQKAWPTLWNISKDLDIDFFAEKI